MEGKELDPVLFSILLHRTEETIAEMVYTMGRVSGNPVVFEAGDHEEAILNARGETVMVGGLQEWTFNLEQAGKYVAETFEDNPGINDGDQFIANDPYLYSVHAQDVQLLAPVFWEGKRVAWVVSAAHHTDFGGMVSGSMCPMATEVYQEAFRIPALKIVEGGRIRKDVEETIRNQVRTPDMCMLDIASKIASNNTGKARLLEMIERYGIDTILAFFDQVMRYSEERLRMRLREICDGSWHAVHYNESIKAPDEPYLKIELTLTKEGDELTFDFTGTSPQSPGSQNLGRGGSISVILCPLLITVAYDIPWSSGLLRPIKLAIPDGCLINPRMPAATSFGFPSGAGFMLLGAVQECLAKMLLAGEKTRWDAHANTGATLNSPIIWGLGKDGRFFVTLVLDCMGGGMGALPDKDGVNCAAHMTGCTPQIANVETNELAIPLLYLTRNQPVDTGGAGKFRGGLGIADAFIPWDTPGERLGFNSVCMGSEARAGTGLCGGYPAPNIQYGFIRNSDIRKRFEQGEMVADVSKLKGKMEMLSTGAMTDFGKSDVFFGYMCCGGGGYGDPIDRDAALVLEDVKLGYVSLEAARDWYGVVIDPKTLKVDLEKTQKQRQRIVKERLDMGRR